MKIDIKAVAAEALAQADESFAATGNVMEALDWVAFAAQSGYRIPPRIGEWLSKALNDYRAGTAPTMDAALGLNESGKAQARLRLLHQSKVQRAMARMMVLRSMGATIEDAATMVASLSPDFKASTLADRYKRSGMGKKALTMRRTDYWQRHGVSATLAEYPDKPLAVAEAKAAILKVYAKPRL
jgi:hypothetical protein